MNWSVIIQTDLRNNDDSDKWKSERREWEKREKHTLTVWEIDENNSLIRKRLNVVEEEREREREKERIRWENWHERRACCSLCLEATENHSQAIFFPLRLISLWSLWS